MVFERLLGCANAKGSNAKKSLMQSPAIKVMKAFLASLFAASSDEFLCSDLCEQAQDCHDLSSADKCIVQDLIGKANKFCPDISFDNIDAVVNIDECDGSLMRITSCSAGRLIIEYAREQISKRCEEHAVDLALASVWEKFNNISALSMDGNIKDAVTSSVILTKWWPTRTRIQEPFLKRRMSNSRRSKSG